MHFVHLKTSGFLRVLRTRDRIVRSNTWFIHSLLGIDANVLTFSLGLLVLGIGWFLARAKSA